MENDFYEFLTKYQDYITAETARNLANELGITFDWYRITD